MERFSKSGQENMAAEEMKALYREVDVSIGARAFWSKANPESVNSLHLLLA